VVKQAEGLKEHPTQTKKKKNKRKSRRKKKRKVCHQRLGEGRRLEEGEVWKIWGGTGRGMNAPNIGLKLV